MKSLTAIIQRQKEGWIALCPELDVASQGGSVEEAHTNLKEAVELYLETASPEELEERLRGEVFITRLEVSMIDRRIGPE